MASGRGSGNLKSIMVGVCGRDDAMGSGHSPHAILSWGDERRLDVLWSGSEQDMTRGPDGLMLMR